MTGPDDRPGRAELLAELDALPIPDRLSMGDLLARRRRRRARRGVTAVVGILAVVGIAAGVITSLPGDDRDVEIAAYPDGLLAPVEPADRATEAPRPTPEPWVWRPSPNLAARDGSTSGVALRHVDDSTDLVLYLLDGPACPDPVTCSESDTDYGMAEFAADTADGGRLNQGVFDPDDGYFRQWNIVAVPHATGDLFRGRSSDPTAVPGESDRNFVGEQNLTRILRSLSGSVEQEGIERIVIAGSGIAGLGVYGAVDIFGEMVPGIEPIAVIDGAPLPASDRLPSTCVRDQWGETWNTTLPAGWSEVVPSDAAGLSGYYTYLDDRHRNGRFALVAPTVPGAVATLLGDQPAGCVAAGSPAEADWPRLVDDLAGEVTTLDSWLVTTVDEPGPALTSTTLTAADTHALHALLDRLLETP